MVTCGLIYLLTKGKLFKWFYHDILGWHLPDDDCGYDGCSYTATCKLCGKDILQDSQGNWY